MVHVNVEIDGEKKFNDQASGCTIESYYEGVKRVTTIKINQDVGNPEQ